MKIIIQEAKSKKEMRQFVHLPNELYEDNPYYVPQMESMDLDCLNPLKNKAFEVCEAKYWLALDEHNHPVGRIAAIINHAYNEKVGKPICRFGWLDFINNREVLSALLSTVEEYALSKGLRIMNGPVGFLEFDPAGILVEGFDKIPTVYGKYNAPYYDPLLSSFGYEKEIDWVEYIIDVKESYFSKYDRMADLIAQRYEFHQARIPNKKDLYPYIDGVFDVMNRCYAKIHGYSELSSGQLEDLKKQFLPNLDPDLVSIVLDKEEKVVGFMVIMPSLSKAMQKANGKLFPFGWYHILKALKRNEVADSLLIAVDPRYQNSGMVAMFFSKVRKGLDKVGVKYIETTRELENNLNVQNLSNQLERHLVKRARCYIKNIG